MQLERCCTVWFNISEQIIKMKNESLLPFLLQIYFCDTALGHFILKSLHDSVSKCIETWFRIRWGIANAVLHRTIKVLCLSPALVPLPFCINFSWSLLSNAVIQIPVIHSSSSHKWVPVSVLACLKFLAFVSVNYKLTYLILVDYFKPHKHCLNTPVVQWGWYIA